MKPSVARELPADVYDALELSAEAFGGIGGGAREALDFKHGAGYGYAPLCVVGHANFLDGYEPGDPTYTFRGPVNGALRRAFNTTDSWDIAGLNDEAVPSGRRISFAAWCKRLNVVRAATAVPAPNRQRRTR